MESRKEEIQINTLLEIIYELYRKDIKKGKTRDEMFKGFEQAVGKSATKAKTFQQSAFDYSALGF